MPRGRPKRLPYVKIIPALEPEPVRTWKSAMDIVALMEAYRAASNGQNRGLFEDCKAEIYRLFALDYNDWRLKEVKATGMSDRVYHEWRAKFVRSFGQLAEAEVAA